MGRVTGAGMQPGADPAALTPRLVVPEGLVIDESARERLGRQLEAAPDVVVGVAAEVSALAPGASYRVHAEWTALETPLDLAPAAGPVRGAVLVRPGVPFAVDDGRVGVGGAGRLVVDPGAHAHDPHQAIGPLVVASERGRPPFPRRPVVVFLGCDLPGDDWLVRLVNRLVRRDVEARIAVPDVVAGLHLTRPCLAEEATIRALAPDVVVTLDDAAAARVDDWCAGDRSTVVVAFDRALRDPMELVSWQLGRASGRLRARVGPRVDVPAFAALVGRLCAGPHPMPPVDRVGGPETKPVVRERWTSREPDDAAVGCVIVSGALDAAASARVEGFADNLEAAGVPVVVARVGAGAQAMPASAADAAVVVLAGLAPTPDVDALVARRAAAGRPTVLDVAPSDIEGDGAGAVRLTAAAAALTDAGAVPVAPGGARDAAARAAGRRALTLPTLLTRDRAAAIRDARPDAGAGPALVIGWRLGVGITYAEAAADGIATILTKRPDRVEIVGDAELLPASLRGHARVAVIPERAFVPDLLAGWAVHVWTPALLGDALVDDARLLEEASAAGVASILPGVALAGVDGFVSPHVQVQSHDRAEEWTNALHHVLDDPGVRAQRAQEARRRADAVDGLAAAKAVVSRFMGWAAYGPARSTVPS